MNEKVKFNVSVIRIYMLDQKQHFISDRKKSGAKLFQTFEFT